MTSLVCDSQRVNPAAAPRARARPHWHRLQLGSVDLSRRNRARRSVGVAPVLGFAAVLRYVGVLQIPCSRPLSTAMAWPVTYEARPDARKAASAANSAGSPSRPNELGKRDYQKRRNASAKRTSTHLIGDYSGPAYPPKNRLMAKRPSLRGRNDSGSQPIHNRVFWRP